MITSVDSWARRASVRLREVPPLRAGGAIVYWHVDDLAATVEKRLSMGAKQHEAQTVRGEGFVTASVVDPFGNVLGVMHNQHYLAVLGRTDKA